jgi:hypothetical protein
METDNLTFLEHPSVVIATNTFICPIVLQYEDTPMIEIVRELQAGFTTKIRIYHNDGTHLADVKGDKVYSTPQGEKAGVEIEKKAGVMVCKLNRKDIFEVVRRSASVLKLWADLHTFDGSFLKVSAQALSMLDPRANAIALRGIFMQGCTVEAPVGIRLGKDGSMCIAASG